MDAVIKLKMRESQEEERQRFDGRNNVIMFSMKESEEEEASKRVEHDVDITDHILDILLIGKSSIMKVIRLGKRVPKEIGGYIMINPAYKQQSSTTEGGGELAVNIATNKPR